MFYGYNVAVCIRSAEPRCEAARKIYVMSSTSPPAVASDLLAAEAEHVTDDLACAECGYNLRTLAIDAGCPECGMSVRVSMRGDRLAAAPPAWLGRMSHGAWWLRASVVLAFPLIYPGGALSCYAVWVLTSPQPGRTAPAKVAHRAATR